MVERKQIHATKVGGIINFKIDGQEFACGWKSLQNLIDNKMKFLYIDEKEVNLQKVKAYKKKIGEKVY